MTINFSSNNPYKNFIDFVIRNYSVGINKKVLINLIKAGCFNSFGINEKTLLNNLDNIINYAELSKDAGMIELSPPNLIPYEDYTKEEIIDKGHCISPLITSYLLVLSLISGGNILMLFCFISAKYIFVFISLPITLFKMAVSKYLKKYVFKKAIL